MPNLKGAAADSAKAVRIEKQNQLKRPRGRPSKKNAEGRDNAPPTKKQKGKSSTGGSKFKADQLSADIGTTVDNPKLVFPPLPIDDPQSRIGAEWADKMETMQEEISEKINKEIEDESESQKAAEFERGKQEIRDLMEEMSRRRLQILDNLNLSTSELNDLSVFGNSLWGNIPRVRQRSGWNLFQKEQKMSQLNDRLKEAFTLSVTNKDGVGRMKILSGNTGIVGKKWSELTDDERRWYNSEAEKQKASEWRETLDNQRAHRFAAQGNIIDDLDLEEETEETRKLERKGAQEIITRIKQMSRMLPQFKLSSITLIADTRSEAGAGAARGNHRNKDFSTCITSGENGSEWDEHLRGLDAGVSNFVRYCFGHFEAARTREKQLITQAGGVGINLENVSIRNTKTGNESNDMVLQTSLDYQQLPTDSLRKAVSVLILDSWKEAFKDQGGCQKMPNNKDLPSRLEEYDGELVCEGSGLGKNEIMKYRTGILNSRTKMLELVAGLNKGIIRFQKKLLGTEKDKLLIGTNENLGVLMSPSKDSSSNHVQNSLADTTIHKILWVYERDGESIEKVDSVNLSIYFKDCKDLSSLVKYLLEKYSELTDMPGTEISAIEITTPKNGPRVIKTCEEAMNNVDLEWLRTQLDLSDKTEADEKKQQEEWFIEFVK